jgi:tetratricopeptide (TPR) repeat protein
MKQLNRLLTVTILVLVACGSSEKQALDRARDALDKRDFSRTVAELAVLRRSGEELPLEARYLLGRAYLGLKNLPEAEMHFKALLAQDTAYQDSVALAYKQRGLELGKVGENELALECFEEAMRISTAIDMSDAYALMGELYTKYGELGRAVCYYRKALATLSDSTTRALTWEKLILILEKLGDPGDAFIATEQAMHEHHYYLEPRYCQNGYTYAQDLLYRGQLDSADLIITRVLQVPLSPMLRDDIYFLAGEIRLKNGDLEGARVAYREVLKLSVNASTALIQRARERLALLGEEVPY